MRNIASDVGVVAVAGPRMRRGRVRCVGKRRRDYLRLGNSLSRM
jgi:hypothetical protein